MTDRVSMLLRGRMLEKFIGQALRDGMRFHSIRRTGARELTLCAAEKYAAVLIEMAGRYGMEISVIGESGRPKIRKRILERGTLPLGLLLGLFLIISFTARIWKVEAVSLDGAAGNRMLTEICEHVRGLGVWPGRLKRDVDGDMLALQLHAQWPELTHVSVRTEGVYLRVEIASEQTAPEVYEIDQCRDLAAARDAVVVRIEPLAGRACVKAGDTVRRGQILIRGEERIDTEQVRSIRALGSVIGRVWFTGEASGPVMKTETSRTGRERVSSRVRLGAWAWDLSDCEEFASQETETESLPIGGLYLPLGIERTVFRETVSSSVPQEINALREELSPKALDRARSALPDGAKETGCRVDFVQENGILTARAVVEAEMEIAAEVRSAVD